MPLPAVLLLLDLYPLRRSNAGWKRLMIEKIPYTAMGVATAVIALIALPRGAGVTSYESYGAAARIGMIAYSLVFYPLKFIFPVRLSPMYELPARVDLASWPFLAALLGVLGVTTILVLIRTRWPGGLAAWTYSALMVLPVGGVVHAGSQLVNDRYSYLSGLGFAVLAGAGVLGVLRLRGRGRATITTVSALVAGAGLAVLTLGFATWTQAQVWRDSETLWRWAVEMDPECSLCHGNLGSAITAADLGRARLDEAEAHLRRAIALRPDNPIPYFNLGTLQLVRTRHAEAEAAFQSYLRLLPGSPSGLGRLGLLYLLQDRVEDAVPLLVRARGLPADAPAAPGRPAPSRLATAIALVEDDPGALMLLGRALVERGNSGDAILALRRAAVLDPGPYRPTSGWSRPTRASAGTIWPGRRWTSCAGSTRGPPRSSPSVDDRTEIAIMAALEPTRLLRSRRREPMRLARLRLVIASLVALALVLPMASIADAQSKGTIKIATQSPLSGGQAALGEGIKLGTQLAIEKFKGPSRRPASRSSWCPSTIRPSPTSG